MWGGSLIGTLASGYLVDLWGFRANFHIGGIFMLLGGGMIALSPGRSGARDRRRRRGRRGSWTLAISPGLVLVSLMGFMRLLVEQGVVGTILPIYARDYLHLDVALIGTLMAVRSVGYIAITVLAGFLSDRVGRRPVLLTGLAVIGLSVFLLSAAGALQLLVPLMFLLGSGSGMVWSVLPVLVSELTDPSVRGLAMGVFRTAFDVGGIIGPILITTVFDYLGVHHCFYIGAALILMNLPLVLPLRKRLLFTAQNTR
ncbi:MAG: MFS transporter, partial [Candidatus Bathyarchaeia archaeon]